MVPFNKYIVLIVASLALAGCFKTTSGVTCPELFVYTQEEQLTLAMELSQAEAKVSQKFITDYGKTRDAIRVCQSWQSE